MSPLKSLLAATAVFFALPAFADGIEINDAYARVSTAMSKSGAAFMVIANSSGADDRLVSVASDVADRVELHTHKAGADGVMQMVEVPEGFAVPAGGQHVLQRGGDHVMFMGLHRSLAQGDVVTVTLTFEKAGDVVLDIPVDLTRAEAPMQMEQGGHGEMHAPSN
jgi:hypothetical protein